MGALGLGALVAIWLLSMLFSKKDEPERIDRGDQPRDRKGRFDSYE